MCISPISIPNKAYRKRSRYTIDDIANHRNLPRVNVPCGKCVQCLQRKRSDITFRLSQELKHCSDAYFVTLTYSPKAKYSRRRLEYYPVMLEVERDGYKFGLLSVDHVQKFLKRFRKHASKHYQTLKENFKYFVVGEYGSKNHRPHYHLILLNTGLSFTDVNNLVRMSWAKYIRNRFGTDGHYVSFGRTDVQIPRSSKVCSYVAKYVSKSILDRQIKLHPQESILNVKQFYCYSVGLGLCFLSDKIKNEIRKLCQKFKLDDNANFEFKLPTYYLRYVFEEDELLAYRKDLFVKYRTQLMQDLQNNKRTIFQKEVDNYLDWYLSLPPEEVNKILADCPTLSPVHRLVSEQRKDMIVSYYSRCDEQLHVTD